MPSATRRFLDEHGIHLRGNGAEAGRHLYRLLGRIAHLERVDGCHKKNVEKARQFIEDQGWEVEAWGQDVFDFIMKKATDNAALQKRLDERPNVKSVDQMLHRTTIEQAKTIEALQKQMEGLQEYAKHHFICDLFMAHEIDMDSKCECGLKELLQGDE